MQEENFQAVLSSPLGNLGISTSEHHLLAVKFIPELSALIKPKTYIAKETVLQLQCYFADPRFMFDLPIALSLTPFQKKVLGALREIPSGETRSYSELASLLQSNPRPIGNACRDNPLPIVIPCHRVIAKTHIGGYAGETTGLEIERKEWLLRHESRGAVTSR